MEKQNVKSHKQQKKNNNNNKAACYDAHTSPIPTPQGSEFEARQGILSKKRGGGGDCSTGFQCGKVLGMSPAKMEEEV